jgi:uncharacterized membrane protein YkoI
LARDLKRWAKTSEHDKLVCSANGSREVGQRILAQLKARSLGYLGRTHVNSTLTTLLGATAIVGVMGAATAARADQEDLRLSSEAKVMLTQAIATAEQHLDGRAIGAKLDDDSFKPAYEVTVVKDNRVFDVYVDAVTNAVISSREDMDD